MNKQLAAISAIALSMTALQAHAAVIAGSLTGGTALTTPPVGSFVLLTPGAGFTVGNNNQQTNNLYAFDEKQGVTLPNNLNANYGGLIAAGTRVNSHYVFFDPLRVRTAKGSVSFDGAVLGVLTARNREFNTDALLGLSGVTYLNPGARGLEAGDTLSILGNSISIDWRASSPGDYVRVLTAVPEPASWAMLIAGFGVAGAALRRRRAHPVPA